jgi:hypothetical protein
MAPRRVLEQPAVIPGICIAGPMNGNYPGKTQAVNKYKRPTSAPLSESG